MGRLLQAEGISFQRKAPTWRVINGSNAKAITEVKGERKGWVKRMLEKFPHMGLKEFQKLIIGGGERVIIRYSEVV